MKSETGGKMERAFMEIKKLTKEVKKMICTLLTAAMVFTNTEITLFAEEDAQTEDTQQELYVEETEEALTDKLSLEEEMTEEAPVREETSDAEDTEAVLTDKASAAEDEDMEEASQEYSLMEETVSETVSSEDTEDTEETKASENEQQLSFSETDIANGEYKEDGNNITWMIDADGKLTVEGTGEFAAESAYIREAPWYGKRSEIKTAELHVAGMENASYMFYECSNLTSVDLSGLDTGSVFSMECMFSGCSSLTNLDLSSLDTSSVSSMKCMFSGCSSLTDLDLSGLDTGRVETMAGMLGGCSSLTDLDLSGLDTSNVFHMENMFAGCSSLINLDLSSFDTSGASYIQDMFSGCSSLTNLDLSSFDIGFIAAEDRENIFSGCSSLSSIYTPKNLEVIIAFPSGNWYDKSGNVYTELPKKLSYSILLTKDEKPKVSEERITAVKAKTFYYVGDAINTDDLIVRYYGSDGTVKELKAAEYSLSNVDTLTVGVEILTVTYKDLTAEIKLTVSAKEEGGDTEESGKTEESGSTESSDTEESETEESGTEESSKAEESSSTESSKAEESGGTESSKAEESGSMESSKTEDTTDSPYPDNEQLDLNTAANAADIKAKVYDGNAYEPAVKVTVVINDKKVTLTEGADYRVRYKENINAGKGKAIISGIESYKGEIVKDLTINPKPVKKLKVITGAAAGTPELSTLPIYVYDGTRLLENGTDYTLSGYEKIKTGAQVTVTGKGNYDGSVTAKLAIYEADDAGQLINPENVSLNDLKDNKTPYTGKAVKPKVTVTINGKALEDKDYKVQYQNNKNAGTAYVIVTGKGGYKGKAVKAFEITAAKASLEIGAIKEKTFNGKLQKPAVKVQAENKKLKANKDYTVTYDNNFHHGEAVVLITGKGNYEGNTETVFTINPQKISKASIKGTKEAGILLTYNKRQLKESVDYTIEYSIGNDGRDFATITGMGDFTGKVTKAVKSAASKNEPSIASKNKNKQNYTVQAVPVTSYLTKNKDNTMMRVEYVKGEVWAETYSSDQKLLTQTQLAMELPIFGGFYAGKDNYFLVFGQKNPEEDDSVEVIRVVKYDKEWNRQGAVGLFGANTTQPFRVGSLRMTECGDMLYIRTCHQMYKSSDGQRHQANLTFGVKISEMSITDQLEYVWNIHGGYVSHSFNQFIITDESDLVAADHGDAYPRSVVLFKYPGKAGSEAFTRYCESVNVLPIQGGIGNNDTGVSVGGLEASEAAYLVAGNSVQQEDADSYNTFGVRNIFVTSTSKSNFTSSGTTLRWITNYTDKSTVKVSTPQLVKLNSKELVLMWSEGSQVKCVLLNASGEPVTGIYSMKGSLSDCQPIVIGGYVVWYYTDDSKPKFSFLNIEEIRGVSPN